MDRRCYCKGKTNKRRKQVKKEKLINSINPEWRDLSYELGVEWED